MNPIEEAHRQKYHTLAVNLYLAYLAEQQGISFALASQRYGRSGDIVIGSYWYEMAEKICIDMKKV